MRRCCSSAASASSSSVIGRYPIPLQAGQVGPKGHSLVRIKHWPSHWRHPVSGVSSIMPTPPQPLSHLQRTAYRAPQFSSCQCPTPLLFPCIPPATYHQSSLSPPTPTQ